MAERAAPKDPQPTVKEPRSFGGTRADETGRVTYTDEGAVSATPGGPLDPTIDPDYQQPGQEPPPAEDADEDEG
jgi:hypothetical protein